MADYLVYWQQYWQDSQDLNANPSKDWSTDSKVLHKTVKQGDCLWVVVSGGIEYPGQWRLREQIRVAYPYPKQEKSKWGKYHIIGNKRRSRIFSIESQPDFAAILLLLQFASGKRIQVLGKRIGQTLQTHGFRKLSDTDATLLEEYAQSLVKVYRGRSQKSRAKRNKNKH